MNNETLLRLSRTFIAITAASVFFIHTAFAAEPAKAATAYTQQINQQYTKNLPFSDRQDFADAQRGFIAPLLDQGILKTASGKPFYRAEDYKFDINAPAPETVNPSLWRQAQLNGDNLNLTLENSVLNYRQILRPKVDASFYMSRTDLHNILKGQAKMADLVKAKKVKVIGNAAKLDEIISCLDNFDLWVNIITPN